MKKLIPVLCCIACVALGALAYMQRSNSDRTAPEITFSDNLIYQEEMEEEELLEDVVATDDVDGDVSASLLIENVNPNEENGTVVVTYVARDTSNNIAKVRRVIPTGTEKENRETQQIKATETELGVLIGENLAETEAQVRVETEMEVERETQSETVAVETESESVSLFEAVAESETMTEAVSESETETESETGIETDEGTEQTEPGAPHIVLKEDSTTISVGEAFEPVKFVESLEDDNDNAFDLWREIQIEGLYDTATRGEYVFYYYVIDSMGIRSNRAKFTLNVQ